ncbi:MAG: 2OG-Fe(II) oxygenase, partial [Deltaproteobacteria bacterium]|nr:2OG-Fe(II) oxygenase [Deltaproteobacteria bacterium]
MSVAELRSALDTLEEESCCSGQVRLTERLALALPDGDVGAIGDPKFVDWLLEHSEPAPYGHGTETKLDPKVRSAQRLKARDKVAVHGFDPAAILDDIAAALSPTRTLSAQLTDVIVYKKGDKFTRHKDTPRVPELIGTLVVGLPLAHTGGAFVVDDGRGPQKFDWSGAPVDQLPWVALFSDVDHEIEPVKSGARVTLVYSLHRTDQLRSDAKAKQRQELVKHAASTLSRQSAWPVLIPCGRHVIAEPEAEQPMSVDTLRGADHDIAQALLAAGLHVDVRAC